MSGSRERDREENEYINPMPMREPIAIIGMGCRFPGGANTPDTYWQLMLEARDATSELPADRWDVRRFYDPDPDAPGKVYVKRGGFLSERIDAFDPGCFGVSPREAEHLDPQQRLLMEVAWEAFEDAGIPLGAVAGSDTGVYVGAFMLDHLLTNMGPMNRQIIGPHSAVGATMTILANRLSYTFDLRGPSFALDTACSSSLVAINEACQDLWRGACRLALAGGVSLMVRPEIWVAMCKGKFLSPDGRCKSFDARANGYARGEGAGVVLLKPLSRAIADGDRIYATIVSAGVNQDGRTPSITQPSPEAQTALIARVCREAGVDPGAVQYFEAHGTGTALGDPLEMRALGGAGHTAQRATPAWVGSVKANIGHLEAAAGVAGLIKAALCLQRERVPPQANLETPNPAIPFAELGLRLPRGVEALERAGEPLRAGVNSFGYGGTNAHVLLQEAPGREDRSAPRGSRSGSNAEAERSRSADAAPLSLSSSAGEVERQQLLVLSARSEGALKVLASRYAEALATQPLADVCYTAARRRTHHDHRLAISARTAAQAIERLRSYAERGNAEASSAARLPADREGSPRGPVFVFTGMGPQWWAMGRRLHAEDASFRAVLERCDAIFRHLSGWSLLAEMMNPEESASRIAETQIAQPANFFLQVALFDAWRRLGVAPAAIVGHSAGEVAAAYAAGALDLEQGVRAIYERSRIQQKTAGLGKMLAVGLSEAEALEAIAPHRGTVSIATINGPRSLTLSGDAAALAAIERELAARGVFNRMLRVEVPYHSPVMDAHKPELRRCLAALSPAVPALPIWSTVTGARVDRVSFDAEYWCDNIREPTLFARAMAGLIAEGHRTFLEIGPHPVLAAAIGECLRDAEKTGFTAYTLHRNTPEAETLYASLGALYTAGAAIDWSARYAEGRFVDLPKYAWQRERYWHESDVALSERLGDGAHVLLGPRAASPDTAFERALNGRYLPCLDDHRVLGATVFPGAGYVELGLAARAEMGLGVPHVLEEVEFQQALVVMRGDEPVVRTRVDEVARTVTIDSRARGPRFVEAAAVRRADSETRAAVLEAPAWTRHATMRVSSASRPSFEKLELAALRAMPRRTIEADAFYRALAQRGLEYGPKLRGVRALQVGAEDLLARIEPPSAERTEPPMMLDPAWLDPCLQAMVALLPADDRRLYLPVRAGQVRVYRRAEGALWCHARLLARSSDQVRGEVTLADDDGVVVARLLDVVFRAVGADRGRAAERWTHVHRFEELAPQAGDAAGHWVLFLDEGGVGQKLAQTLRAASSAARVTTVLPGDRFGRETEHAYRVPKSSLAGARSLFAELDIKSARAIVYLWSLDESEDALGAANAAALLRVAQALEAGPRLYAITRDVFCLDPADASMSGVAAATAGGLMRVVAGEKPGLRATSIDLSANGDPSAILAAAILCDDAENEVALRNGRRWVRRLEQRALSAWEHAHDEAARASTRVEPGAARFVLEGGRARAIDAHGEIEVHAIARRAGWPIEFSGVLRGKKIAGLQRREAIASHLDLDDVLSFEHRRDDHTQLAGTILPAAIAGHALKDLARVKPGETVLIHGDDRDLGDALAGLAIRLGARVLRAAPDEHAALDSASADFTRRIAGEKIAVLINVAPNADRALAAVLEPGARVVELGGASSLLPAALARGAACFAIDPRELFTRKPELLADPQDRAVSTLPIKTIAELGESNGDVCLSMRSGHPFGLAPASAASRSFDGESTHLVTGGFGGFGLSVARWLVDHGVRHLILAGRRGPQTDEAQQALAALRKKGATVHTAALDITDKNAVAAMLARIPASLPLKGVFHAAGVLDDAPIDELDERRIQKVLEPKARGALLLHELTQSMRLDAFVLFSSVSALIGNPRQGNYVAANAFMDALAEHRFARGLPGLSVQWGVIDETGMASGDAVRAYLKAMGLAPMPADAALHVLSRVMRLGVSQVGIADVDWPALFAAAPHLGRTPRMRALAANGAESSAGSSLGAQWKALAPEARVEAIAAFLIEQLAETLRMDGAKIDPHAPLPALGIDSLLAMQVQEIIRRRVGLEVPALELLRGATVAQLAKKMSALLAAPGANEASNVPTGSNASNASTVSTASTADVAAPAIDKQVEEMSDAEVDAMLESLLTQEGGR